MAHVFTGWMAFESGKTFLLSLKLFQQVVLVQIAKLTLGVVHKLRLQILPIFDHLPTSVNIC